MRGILPPIILTSQDYLRLEQILADAVRDRHPVASFLMSEVDRAYVCDDKEVPPDIVRLNDWVTYRVGDDPRKERKVLVCSEDFNDGRIHLSVLSLMGSAVLGLRAGDRLRFPNYKGELTLVTVESIGPQPDEPPFLTAHRGTRPLIETSIDGVLSGIACFSV